ncbi:uncharacterized protein G2W53_039736 [Senna tora]|uniref:Uncharacterized protein n=1 Tax=Senna tora TaxID=362788 RepID=A0A834W335_9FABA|nr:uncharacterized protein G2W53_039736 [Senna tora]
MGERMKKKMEGIALRKLKIRGKEEKSKKIKVDANQMPAQKRPAKIS